MSQENHIYNIGIPTTIHVIGMCKKYNIKCYYVVFRVLRNKKL